MTGKAHNSLNGKFQSSKIPASKLSTKFPPLVFKKPLSLFGKEPMANLGYGSISCITKQRSKRSPELGPLHTLLPSRLLLAIILSQNPG